jgi:hypothetical protein
VTVLQILREARASINAPEKWAKGTYARDMLGLPVESHDLRACSLCVVGAIERTGCVGRLRQDAMSALRPDGWSSLDAWNDADGTTHADVMDRFDRTIARLEGAK